MQYVRASVAASGRTDLIHAVVREDNYLCRNGMDGRDERGDGRKEGGGASRFFQAN